MPAPRPPTDPDAPPASRAGPGRWAAAAALALAAAAAPARAGEAPLSFGGDPASPRGDGVSGVAPALLAAAAKRSGAAVRRVALGPVDRAALLAEDGRVERRRRPGLARTGIRRRFARVSAPRHLAEGARGVTVLDDGTRVWTAEFSAPGAQGVRLRFDTFELPAGARAVLYDAEDPAESYGPFTGFGPRGTGEFHAPTVFGDRVRLEVSVPAESRERVSVAVRSALLKYRGTEPLGTGAGKTAGVPSCHTDVACVPGWDQLVHAVARVDLTDGSSLTGCLVSDTDFLTALPWFVTSASALSEGGGSADAEFYWDYASASCGVDPPGIENFPRTIGAQVAVASPITDIALLRLSGTLPGGRVFASWTTDAPATAAPVTSLLHAGGARMGIVQGAAFKPEPAYHQIYWTSGAMGAGAAGAPLFDGSQRFVGQLAFATSTCGGANGPDSFGRFEGSWPDVREFLDPSGTVDPPDPDPIAKLFWNIWNVDFLRAGEVRRWQGDILEYSTYARPNAAIRVTLRGRRGSRIELTSPSGETFSFARRGRVSRPEWGNWLITLYARETGRSGKYRVRLRKNV